MLRGKDVEEINELKRQGLSIRAISQLTGYDRRTITRYLLKPAGKPAYGPRPAPVSKLEPFKPYLKERLQAGVWNAQVLLRELRERNYDGSYTILTDWLRPQRKEAWRSQFGALKRRRANRRKSIGGISARCTKGARSISSGPSPSRWATAAG